MTEWLAQISSDAGEFVTERHIEFNNLPPPGWAVAALILIIGILWWIVRAYQREQRTGCTRQQRGLLAGLRCLVILILAVIWFQPVQVNYVHHLLESYTLVLADHSASMNLIDAYRDAAERNAVADFLRRSDPAADSSGRYRREDLLEQILNTGKGEFFQKMARRNAVRVYDFSDATHLLASIPAQRSGHQNVESVTIPAESWGASTDPGRSIREVVESVRGSPVAGVIVLSDGGFNAGEDVETLGEYARRQNIPVHTVGIGSGAEPINVRVAELSAPVNAFVHDPFEIQARIETSGSFPETELELRLSADREGSSNGRGVIAVRRISVQPGEPIVPLQFEHRPVEAGRYEYELEAIPLADEITTADNRQHVRVNVTDAKIRVLLIAGGPGWTYQYLARLLQRDSIVNVSCWLQSAETSAIRDGDIPIDRFPDQREQLFDYDVVILLDPDPQGIPAGWSDLVDRHVTRDGAGLIYGAGRENTPRFFRDSNLAGLISLLPIVPDPEADLRLNQIGFYQKNASEIVPDTAPDNPIASLFADTRQDRPGPSNLRSLLQVYWYYPVLHEKPAASVWLRHGDPRMRNAYGPHVLLATQPVGAGRSAFLGFDGTWRWRRGGEEFFNRFWIQLIRQMSEGKWMQGDPRGRILTDRATYTVGETVQLSAKLTDLAFQSLDRQQITVQIESEDASQSPVDVVLTQDAAQKEWFRGSFTTVHTGRYKISLMLHDESGSPDVTFQNEFDVQESQLEIRNPRMNRQNLETLSRRSAGGAYCSIDHAMELVDQIPDLHETRTVRGTPQPIWDHGICLGLLIGLLALEWSLRKKWNLL